MVEKIINLPFSHSIGTPSIMLCPVIEEKDDEIDFKKIYIYLFWLWLLLLSILNLLSLSS